MSGLLEKLPLLDLEEIELEVGSHDSRETGVCVMEAVAWVAGELHSARPMCACPVITRFMTRWNDRLPSNSERNRLLKPLVPLVVGTRSTSEVERRRLEMIRDFVARDAAAAALSLAGLHAAAMLRAEPTLENIWKARDQAWEARAAARKRLIAAVIDAEIDAVIDAVIAAGIDALELAAQDLVRKMCAEGKR